MSDINEAVKLIEKQGDELSAHYKKTDARFSELEKDLNDIHKKAGRPSAGDGDYVVKAKHEEFFDVKTKKSVPVLAHSNSLASLDYKANLPSIGRILRGIALGGRNDDAGELELERKSLGIAGDPSGGYTVSGALSSQWIDTLRASMVLSRAGARTIPMESGTLSLARVVTDPTCSWHGENAALADSSPTFGSVNLAAKTVVCLVKLSLELAQDSANIEQILQSTITNAMAAAIDRAGLVGTSTDAAGAPSGIMNLENRNSVTAIGAPTAWDFLLDGMYELAADNVPLDNIGAFVAHPAVWLKMRKLKTGITNDKTPLTMPAEIAALPKLWTTAAPLTGGTTASGIIADWRDLIFGVRKDISIRVLSETFMGSNLQLAVLAYSRVDFAATRAQSFCTLEGITI